MAVGEVLLFHGPDVFQAFGYANSGSALPRFLDRNSSFSVHVMLAVPDALGRVQETAHLTAAGVVLTIAQVGQRVAGKQAAARFAAALLSRLLPDGTLAADVAMQRALDAGQFTVDALRRLVWVLIARVTRMAHFVEILGAEVDRLRDADERASAVSLLRTEVDDLRGQVRRLEERAMSSSLREARLLRDIEHLKGEIEWMKADREKAAVDEAHWKGVAESLIRRGGRKGPSVDDVPEGGVN